MLKNYLLDILFPRQCLGCKKNINSNLKSFVCPGCLKSIRLEVVTNCAFCGAQVIKGRTCVFCKKENDHYLDSLFVTADYKDPLVKKMIKSIKYRFVKDVAGDIAQVMYLYSKRKEIDKTISNFLLSPVPLYWHRRNWRGFNQAEMIALELGKRLKISVETRILLCNKARKPQAEIENRETRIRNSKGIFVCKEPNLVRNKKVVVIDDVSTTASTLNDCARVLKNSGASEVIGFVFARG